MFVQQRWIRHLKHVLSHEAIREFAALWIAMSTIILNNEDYTVSWRWTVDGVFTTKSAYLALFEGSKRVEFADFVWKSDAPGKCKIFCWLAILGRCNTADVLAKKGWPHNTACALCSGPMEDALHLLANCAYSKEVWRLALTRCALPPTLEPTPGTASLWDFCSNGSTAVTREMHKAWSSFVQILWWNIWKERNARIFRNESTRPTDTVLRIIEEAKLWHAAGKTKVLKLFSRPREPD